VDGILVIDKPEDWTSHDVVARVRRLFKTKRVGHTGTLDPFATGVLVILVGKATRLAKFLDKDEKEYEAVVQFGFATDTGDRTGTPTVDACLRSDEIAACLATANLDGALRRFRGEIVQIPPMYSAKKIQGKKLYELARAGIVTDRKPVRVSISTLELLQHPDPTENPSAVGIRVACSAGTYIRTLAEDIGGAIGLPAHLNDLRRTRAGRFTLTDCVTIEQLQASPDPSTYLLNISIAVEHLPEFSIPQERIERTRNGLATRVEGAQFSANAAIRMTDESGELIAVGFFDSQEKTVQPKIVLV